MKNPAVAAGGAAAGVEDPGHKEPEDDSDMAGDNKQAEQEQKQNKNEVNKWWRGRAMSPCLIV